MARPSETIVRFQCKHCGNDIELSSSNIGKQVGCPSCENTQLLIANDIRSVVRESTPEPKKSRDSNNVSNPSQGERVTVRSKSGKSKGIRIAFACVMIGIALTLIWTFFFRPDPIAESYESHIPVIVAEIKESFPDLVLDEDFSIEIRKTDSLISPYIGVCGLSGTHIDSFEHNNQTHTTTTHIEIELLHRLQNEKWVFIEGNANLQETGKASKSVTGFGSLYDLKLNLIAYALHNAIDK